MPAAFHALSADACLTETKSTPQGLSEDEARKRLSEYGPNALPEKKRPGPLSMFVAQFKDFLILILIAAAAISFMLGEALDAAAIVAVVLLNAALGFAQEYRAERALASLRKLVAAQATVLRDGAPVRRDIPVLVPGDVVLLEAGDKVPADCRLLETHSLEIDESSLTGESVPAEKSAEGVYEEKALVAERINMAFLGTIVTRGKAKALVVSTGQSTQLGRVAELVQEVGEEQTPLQQKLEALGKQLGVIALAITFIIFVFGIWRGQPWFDVFLLSVSLAVAAIPEGLPAVVTIALAVGVQRMVKRHAIIRKLPAVEGLGAATVICSDKTGTLTRNEMTVRKLYADGKLYSVSGNGYALSGEFTESGRRVAAPAKIEAVGRLMTAALLCNNAELKHEEEEAVATILGDPTEASLLVLAHKAGLPYAKEKAARRFIEEFPFESERKMMSVVYEEHGTPFAFVKGAPESLIENSTHAYLGGKVQKLTDAARKDLAARNRAFSGEALRVLGFAYKELPKKTKYIQSEAESGLVFLGLVGMIDPPRTEAKEAVALCKSAGIKVFMITGDNPDTARAIAAELGISSPGLPALDGRALNDMADADLEKAVRTVRVFARVSPEHKLRIVSALQRNGEVVAMTGDGVNDAPAVKKADVGVSMGLSGTEVTKESSDMVVTDDNFASIVAAVEEGRIIYDNIIKSVKFLVSCNIGEILAIFIAMLASLPSPLLPIQILWMNLITDSFPALALGMDPKSPDVMRRPPLNPTEKVLNRHNLPRILLIGLVVAFATLAIFFAGLQQGRPLSAARSTAFSVIVIIQLFLALSYRSEEHSLTRLGWASNKWLLLAVFGGIFLQIAVVQTGVLEPVFETTPLSLAEWFAVLGVAAAPFLSMEVMKHAFPKPAKP